MMLGGENGEGEMVSCEGDANTVMEDFGEKVIRLAVKIWEIQKQALQSRE